MHRNPWFLPTLLVLVWVIMVCIINPIGNFPINDDWQYARPVSSLVNQGRYISPDAYSPIIIAQVFYGAFFCKVFGFSFTVLRFSVLILGIIGVLVFYALTKLFTGSKVAFIGALILLVNPLYFSLANSFMTDVPFLVFSIISMYFFILSIEKSKPARYIILATVFACIATLVRQFAVIIPMAFGLTMFITYWPKIGKTVKYFIPAIVAVAVYRIGLWWLAHIGSELKPYVGQQVDSFLNDIPGLSLRLLSRTGLIIYYASVFLLPLLAILSLSRLKNFSVKQRIITGVLLAICCIPLLRMWNTIPYGNYLNEGFIGPRTVKHIEDSSSGFSHPVHILISVICFFCAILLLLQLVLAFYKPETLQQKGPRPVVFYQRIFIVLCISGYSFLVFVFLAFFDRYLLLPVPLLFLLFISNPDVVAAVKGKKLILSYSIIFLIGVTTIIGTHDYMEWNRCKWEALNYLTKECNISPRKIDGGYEFNGWYNIRSFDGKATRSCIYVDDDEYIVTHNTGFGGYKIIKQFTYRNYFPFEEKTMYIFH